MYRRTNTDYWYITYKVLSMFSPKTFNNNVFLLFPNTTTYMIDENKLTIVTFVHNFAV